MVITNTNLAELLKLATETGSSLDVKAFLHAFLETPVYVPERYQVQPLSDQPVYPNDLFYLLGIKSIEQTILPAFTEQELIFDWSGNDLSYKTLTGLELCQLAPSNWQICLNPGQEYSKEFSAWEIEQLKLGSQAIDEVVAEIAVESDVANLTVRPLKEGEFSDLVLQLQKDACENPIIKAAYILIEETADTSEDSGSGQNHLLLGLECTELDQQSQQDIHDYWTSILAPYLIGDLLSRVFVYSSDYNQMTGRLFAQFGAVYSKK